MSEKSRRVAPAAPTSAVILPVGSNFYLLDEIKAVVEILDGEDRFLPATCLPHDKSIHSVSEEGFLETLGAKSDDVWSADFLQGRQRVSEVPMIHHNFY